MVSELSHPIIKFLVNRLRDKNSDALRFRQTIGELTRFLCYEAFKEFSLQPKNIQTWQGEKPFAFLDETNILFVTILRAGLPMLESTATLFPQSQSGFLAMRRDEHTHQSILYYDRVPKCSGKTVILLDPMIATGGSLSDAIAVLRSKLPQKIITLNIIGSPEGIAILEKKHPDIDIFIAQIDDNLDENMFIVPGLGDAGDRSYNT